MMRAYLNDKVLHGPGDLNLDANVLNLTVEREANKIPVATFEIQSGHPLYGEIYDVLTDVITVYSRDTLIFRGRIDSVQTDLYLTKTVTAKGDLSYLADSVCRPFVFSGSIIDFLSFVIDQHNACNTGLDFKTGIVTVTDSNDYIVRESEYALSTWEVINTRLIDNLGGYIRIREEGGFYYLDYLADFDYTCNQWAVFGKNITDYLHVKNSEELITCLIPYGADIQEDDPEYVEPTETGTYDGNKVTIRSVNNGSDFVQNSIGISIFGKIWGTQTWDDVTLPKNLLDKANKYLSSRIGANVSIEISALDLSLIDPTEEIILDGMYVRCKSTTHEIDILLPCTKVTILADDPSNSRIYLGLTTKSLTEQLGG